MAGEIERALLLQRRECRFQGDRFILVEGALLLEDEDLAGLIDVKVYMDASKETCSQRYGGDPQ